MGRNKDGELVWDDEMRMELFTPLEIAECDLRVELINEIIKARNKKGKTQQELQSLTGIPQQVISRFERGITIPRLDTILKLLLPLGKTLAVVPLKKNLADYVAKNNTAAIVKKSNRKSVKKPESNVKTPEKDNVLAVCEPHAEYDSGKPHAKQKIIPATRTKNK